LKSLQDEALKIIGVLGAGLFWEESLFWEHAYFWEKYMFWEHVHFWIEKPIFGVRAIGGKKSTCRKRRKNNMQEEK
jgi:hypothetical protein